MRSRVAGAGLLALGAALGALPAFGWYQAPPVGMPTRASGFAGAGQLWMLPLLGAMVAIGGALLAAAPSSDRSALRRVGALCAVCGAVALALAVWAAAGPRLELRAALPEGVVTVPARVSLEPAAFATPLVAGAILLAGLALMLAGRRG